MTFIFMLASMFLGSGLVGCMFATLLNSEEIAKKSIVVILIGVLLLILGGIV